MYLLIGYQTGITVALFLFFIFEIKHFLCDFVLQTDYMLGKFKEKGWVLPLASHCAVHGLFTLLILLAMSPKHWYLCLIDFIWHFAIDRIKASPRLLGRFKPLGPEAFKHAKEIVQSKIDWKEKSNYQLQLTHNRLFWWFIGLDQLCHQLTTLYIIFNVLRF